MDYLSTERVEIRYTMPLAEIIFDFFDQLKSRTRGYASLDYEPAAEQEANLVKVDILLQGQPVDAFSQIVHADKARDYGVAMTAKLKELIPRQQFEVPIQAAIGSRVIARENIRAMRKDVLAKCYGGDITPQAQTARAAEGGQAADEDHRPRGRAAGGVRRRAVHPADLTAGQAALRRRRGLVYRRPVLDMELAASARVVSINTGRGVAAEWAGALKRTAIDKRPVTGPVAVGRLGLAGDEQADRKHHGGYEQAVNAYAREDLDWWKERLGRELPGGTFGENITTACLDISGALIGERAAGHRGGRGHLPADPLRRLPELAW